MKMTKEQKALGGRVSSRKGIPNKSTSEMRETVRFLLEETAPVMVEKFYEVLDRNPEKGLDLWIKLSEFVIPKLQRTEVSGNLTIERLLQLNPEQRKSRIIELANKINDTR